MTTSRGLSFWQTCGVAGMVAIGLAFWTTAHGVGVSRDSVQYFHYAQILTGREPMRTDGVVASAVTHYPPLYPALLAALTRFGIGLPAAARVIDVVCFSITATLAAGVVLRSTGSRTRASVAAVLVMVQPAVVSVHLWAFSEPPFLVLVTGVVALLAAYRAGGRSSWRMALTIGATIGAATLTRYIGVALLPAALWAVWRSGGRRARDALVICATSMLPVILLSVVQHAIGGVVANRSLEFHPLTTAGVAEFVRTIGEWLANRRLFGATAGGVAGAIAIVLAAATVLTRHPDDAETGPTPCLASVVGPIAFIYLVSLIASVMFVDNATPLDDRLLSPVALVLTMWLAADGPSPFAPPGRRRAAGWVLAAVGVVVGANDLVRSANDVRSLRVTGLGFNHVVYRDSPLVAACRGLPRRAVIYSNFPEAIWLHAGREALILPGHPTAIGRQQEPLDRVLAVVRDELRGGGFVAYFARKPSAHAAGIAVSIDELKTAMPLRLVERTTDGTLLRSRDAATTRAAAPAPSPVNPGEGWGEGLPAGE